MWNDEAVIFDLLTVAIKWKCLSSPPIVLDGEAPQRSPSSAVTRCLHTLWRDQTIDQFWDFYSRQSCLKTCLRGNNVDLVLCVLLGHQNSKIANSMKLVNFALFSSQYHVFELKNIRGNLIAPNSNRWSLSNKIAMSQEDNRKIISLFGQEKSIFLHPWMLKDLM